MKNIFKKTFLFIVLIELLSIFAYLVPEINRIVFSILVLIVLFISLYDLRFGLLMVLAELFISSKGYLFYLDIGGINISIRIALWLIVMAVWFSGYMLDLFHCQSSLTCHSREGGNPWWFKIKRWIPAFVTSRQRRDSAVAGSWTGMTDESDQKNKNIKFYFIPLFIFIIWGIINGMWQGNSWHNLFFDFNGWVYFALIFPVYSVFNSTFCGFGRRTSGNRTSDVRNQFLNDLSSVFLASITWLSLKTFILLYIFSHEMTSIMPYLYKWIRTTGVGEITKMEEGFYRIFFQSHIYVLIGFLILLIYLMAKSENLWWQKIKRWILSFAEVTKGEFSVYTVFNLAILFLAVTIINFSRSNWVGLIVGVGILFLINLTPALSFVRRGRKFSCSPCEGGDREGVWKRVYKFIAIFLAVTIMSFVLIIITIKFPYPDPSASYNTGELIAKRAGQVSGEAGVSSRWNLLPELWKEIKTAPVMGKGFGATVTYKSNDPRVLETHADDKYTTYAFEWGWLEIWLKLGFFGCLAYLILIGRILFVGYKQLESRIKNQELIIGLLIGLIVISAINFFSPYLNHPLGIGYLILVAVIIDNNSLRERY